MRLSDEGSLEKTEKERLLNAFTEECSEESANDRESAQGLVHTLLEEAGSPWRRNPTASGRRRPFLILRGEVR